MNGNKKHRIYHISDYIGHSWADPPPEEPSNLDEVLSAFKMAEQGSYMPILTDEDIVCLKNHGIIE